MLATDETQALNWSGAESECLQKIHRFPLYRIGVIGDGSCLCHAVARALSRPYTCKNMEWSRSHSIRKLRDEIADCLPNFYDSLSSGTIKEFASVVPEYSLSSLQELFRSSAPLGQEAFEIITKILNVDVYLLDLSRKDVYMMSGRDLLYKKRKSVIIVYSAGHYEAVGVYSAKNNCIATLFDPNFELIVLLRQRINELEK
jgi:hypothetical protein